MNVLEKTKFRKKTLIIIGVLFFSVVPIKICFTNFAIGQEGDKKIYNDPVVWDSSNYPREVIDGMEYQFKSDLTIEEGVELRFKRNIDCSIEGNLIINGSGNKPVKFMGESQDGDFVINTYGSKVDIINAEFTQGGNENCIVFYRFNTFFSSAFAQECVPRAALNIFSPEAEITHSKFVHNIRGINYLGSGNVLVDANTFAHSKEERSITVDKIQSMQGITVGCDLQGQPTKRIPKVQGRRFLEVQMFDIG